MKTWIQTLFAAFLACVWALPPQAYALPSASSTAMTLKAVFTVQKSKFGISLVNKEGAAVSEFFSTPTTDLAKNLPSQMAKEMKKTAGFSFSKMALEKLMRFPVETLGFFISLGAVVTYDMMTKASQNPVGFEQLIDSQLDPIGQLGFYAFMLANGAAAEPFMHMIQNGKLHPRFAPFLVYGGMSIGMVASNIVHEIGHWPGLGQCAADLWTKASQKEQAQNYKNCDQAAKHWGERGGFGGITNQWAPGLISLIGSTLLASAIQGVGKVVLTQLGRGAVEVVIFAGRWTLGKVIQIAAVEIGLFLVPGGVVMRGIRLVTPALNFIGQMTLFNGVQQWLETRVTSAYNNYTQSSDAVEIDNALLNDLLAVKSQKWDDSSTQKLTQDVTKLSAFMKTWRQSNMNEVLQMQSNWEQKLGQLTMMYASSELFYADFINRLWQRKFGPYKDSYASGQSVSILDQNFPLNGVTVAPSEGKDETTWLEAPDQIEDRQIVTIQNVLKNFAPKGLSAEDLKIFNSLKANLLQSDRTQIGKALDQLNCYLHTSTAKDCKWQSISMDLTRSLMDLRNALGKPQPIWQPGLGYIVAYSNTPSRKALIEKTLFQKSFGTLTTPTLPESMIASMFFGPDVEKGESTVITSNGFKDLFKAPRIRYENQWQPNLKVSGVSAPLPDVFNSGIFNYFNKGYVNTKILNANADSFKNWWKQYPETHYLQAWLDYERLYQQNIAHLIEALNGDDISFAKTVSNSLTKHNNGDSSLMNHGPVANSLLKSLEQEIRLYTMVLGEVMKDSYFLQAQKSPEEAFSKTVRLINTNKDSNEPQLLSYLKLNNIMDFAAYAKAQKLPVSAALDFSERRNLVWQEQLLAKFDEIHGLFKKLQVRQIQTKAGSVEAMPVSTLSAKDLEAKTEDLKQYMEQLKQTAFPDELFVNAGQKALVEACFKGIEQSLVEMKGLVDAANAASYVERHDSQGHSSRRCLNSNKPQTGLGGIQAVQRAAEGC